MYQIYRNSNHGLADLFLMRIFIIAVMISVFMLLAVSAPAQQVTHLRLSNNEIGATQYLQVGRDKSVIVDLPKQVREVIVSQPNVAGIVMRSKRRAILQGVGVGETNIFFLDAKGARIAVLEVSVVADASGLAATMSDILPGSNIKVESFGDRVVLSGTVRSGDDMEKAVAIASQFAGGKENVANILKIEGAQQVLLKVTIAEVGRETVKQLGINLSGSLGAGSLSTSMISAPPIGGASNVITPNTVSASVGVGELAISATLRALERRGALRTLAEPTLSALSGQSAEFLAGGEFPVPVGFDNGQVLFEFKKFGVELKFTPTVKSNGVIALVVDAKVSEPTTEGGFNSGGITIPATRERQAKTTVELRSGSTMAIAGLIEEKVRAQINAMPGIGKLPILGALFRSRDFVRSETELLILVTPILAVPGGPVDLPTDKMVFAGDAEAVFLGHIEKLYGVGSNIKGEYQGSVGFVLD